ncbi:unnamed protein product [Clavelina lepadiformis]|uniref:DUF3800 domain-containing protein n=1 Tax=Clavelina lepadiformis TaxID=159417 RepID=A0ABP0GW98_CLALP
MVMSFALLAIDESGNRVDPSNVALITYFYSPPVVIQPTTVGDSTTDANSPSTEKDCTTNIYSTTKDDFTTDGYFITEDYFK